MRLERIRVRLDRIRVRLDRNRVRLEKVRVRLGKNSESTRFVATGLVPRAAHKFEVRSRGTCPAGGARGRGRCGRLPDKSGSYECGSRGFEYGSTGFAYGWTGIEYGSRRFAYGSGRTVNRRGSWPRDLSRGRRTNSRFVAAGLVPRAARAAGSVGRLPDKSGSYECGSRGFEYGSRRFAYGSGRTVNRREFVAAGLVPRAARAAGVGVAGCRTSPAATNAAREDSSTAREGPRTAGDDASTAREDTNTAGEEQ